MEISVTVNGVQHTHDVEPRTLLVQYIREQVGLTGTNIGCDTSSCGACTVHMDGESVKSCTVLAVQADGSTSRPSRAWPTDGVLHPMQQAFMENHGLQCGYCTPGMVMAAAGLLNENPHPTEQEVRIGLEGNLCRCTGYHNIVQAVLARGGSAGVIPAAFDYVRAGSAEEAISLLGEHGDEAKFLAGGHSLLPLMKLRLAQPSVLIDIGRLSDLSYIREDGDIIAIGALTRHRDVENSDAAGPARAAARPRGQPRRRPAGAPPRHDRRLDRPRRPGVGPPGHDAGARRHVRRAGPERHARDRRRRLLRVVPRPTALADDELLTEIRVPKMNGAGWSFQKFNRRAQDWAIVGVAAWRNNGDAGVGLVNMGSTPILATSVAAALGGGALDRRGRRAGRRRGRAAGRPQRQRRVPHPPGQGAHPPRPRGRQQLTFLTAVVPAERAQLHREPDGQSSAW